MRRRCPQCLGRGSSAADVCSSSRPASRERRRGGRAAARQRACFPSHVRGARGRHAVGDCAGRLWRRQPLHRRACCKPRRVGQSIMHDALHAHVSRLAQVLRRRSAKTAAAFRLASCCGSLRSDVSRTSFAQAFTCAKPLRQAQRRSQWGDARARLLGRKASHRCSDARARLSLPHLPAPSGPVCQRHSLCSRTSAWLSAAMLTVCAATAALPTCGSAPRPCCAVAQPCCALATAARLQKRVSHRGARVCGTRFAAALTRRHVCPASLVVCAAEQKARYRRSLARGGVLNVSRVAAWRHVWQYGQHGPTHGTDEERAGRRRKAASGASNDHV